MLVERIIGERRLRAECSAANARRAGSVLDVFAKLAASGKALAPGTQIRFGWSLLHLVEDADGLRVAEPDFSRWPEPHWARTIDVTLDVLAAQTALLHRTGADGDDAWFDQNIIAAPGALGEREIFLRRGPTVSAEDSGWVLGALAAPEALAAERDLDAVLIAVLVARRPALLQVLALPAGFIAVFSGDDLQQVFDSAGRACFP